MNIDQKIVGRLEELITYGKRVLSQPIEGQYLNDDGVDPQRSSQWGVSSLSIIARVFGKESDHYTQFNTLFRGLDAFTTMRTALGILEAAKDDYENGYLFETRTLIQAEVFNDFLEQAEHLFERGYYQAAAVVAGAVLEDGLRQLCTKNGIPLPAKPKIETMNAELARASVYNHLIQKRITELAELRNSAAHGQWQEFKEEDVRGMLQRVRSFMEDYLS